MRGFATSPNPYATGMRPRRFLEARLRMLRNKQTIGTAEKRNQEVRKTIRVND